MEETVSSKEFTPLEVNAERNYTDYVKRHGYEAIKIDRRGYPDRLTLLDYGYCFLIEFKRDKKTFTKRKGEKLQAYTHDQLRSREIHVYLCDTVYQAITIFHYEVYHCEKAGTKFEPYLLSSLHHQSTL